MPDNEPVARGDRREDLWIEADKDQKTRVRHTFPSRPPVEQVSEAAASGRPCNDAEVTDAAIVREEPSAWEALEDDAEG